jgi:hypothetical protein
MKTGYSFNLKPTNPSIQPQQPRTSLQVRTGVRSGAWYCNTCEGKVSGNQLFKPTCEYCQPS